MRTEGKFVVGVLIASVLVALVLAFQAISSARSRQAITDAMLRQYAELAATEYARAARRGVEMSISRRLSSYVHPRQNDRCECSPLMADEYWFEVGRDGEVIERTGAIPAAARADISRFASRDRTDANGRMQFLPSNPAQLVILRAEPHAASGGGVIGLVINREAMAPMLKDAFNRARLLPEALLQGRDWRGLVDLRVDAADGHRLFATDDTSPGPQVATTPLLPDDESGLRISASMTPAFIASLGPEHTGGPNGLFVIGLVIVNVMMVTVGLWQLGRERELSRLREDFVAGVSHELRTPLAQIRMFADTLLLDRIRNPQEGRRAIEIISQETRRLGQLVENVLYFHRHRRAPATPAGTAMSLTALVLEVTESFKPLAASKRVRLASNIPAHDVIVIGNADGLRQVLLNLLDNAVKFGPADSTVTVTLQTAGDRARLMVDDQGAGVPAADRRRIFEPFERGETRGAGGAGIGLAVVHQIVAEHVGTARVDTAPSGGARFVIDLPLLAEEPAMPALAG